MVKTLVKYVRENNVDCGLCVGDTLDVPVTPEVADIAENKFERFKVASDKVDHVKFTHDPTEAAKLSLIKYAKACYAWLASTLHPWKLAAHIMRDNLKKGVSLYTRTKATCIIRSLKNPEKWVVKCERVEIKSSQVIHATNAYSSALEPYLRGLIQPSPHMCDRIKTTVTFTGSTGLNNSYGVVVPKWAYSASILEVLGKVHTSSVETTVASRSWRNGCRSTQEDAQMMDCWASSH